MDRKSPGIGAFQPAVPQLTTCRVLADSNNLPTGKSAIQQAESLRYAPPSIAKEIHYGIDVWFLPRE
jgi:hypothetical protein